MKGLTNRHHKFFHPPAKLKTHSNACTFPSHPSTSHLLCAVVVVAEYYKVKFDRFI